MIIFVACLGRNRCPGEHRGEAVHSCREGLQRCPAESVRGIQIPRDCWCDGLRSWHGPHHPCSPLGQGERDNSIQCTVVFVEVRFLCLLYSTLHDGILILIFMMMQNTEVALIYISATRLAKFLTTLIYSSDLVTTTPLTNHSHSDCVGKANPHRENDLNISEIFSFLCKGSLC